MEKLVRGALPVFVVALVWTLVAGLSASAARSLATSNEIPAPPVSEVETPQPVDELVPLRQRLVPAAMETPRRIGTCVLPGELVEFGSGTLSALVSSLSTGQQLWGVQPEEPAAPASVIKLLTAVAAWNTLGPDHRLETTVVAGSPGEVWLVGGGDPTLTRAPANNYYDAHGSLAELARLTRASLLDSGMADVSVVHLDDTRYGNFASWDETWRTNAWALGFVAPVTALQVDGDRNSPAVRLSPRSTDPTGRAGQWFADALMAEGNVGQVTVGQRAVAPEGPVIATVYSAPVRDLIGVMLEDSDNQLAEVLAREVAIAQGLDSLEDALIHGSGLDPSVLDGAVIRDGSGLSPKNQLSANSIVDIVEAIANHPEMSDMLWQLPVSGETGSLRLRFAASGSEAAGSVKAKTGSIVGVRSLAGIIHADDGSDLVFSLNVSGRTVSDATRNRIDALVAGLFSCGENLAHWSEEETQSTRE